jgi:hypothetical protein
MSPVKKFRVQTRLSRLAINRGGITAHQAIKQADVALEALHETCVETIDVCLAEIERRFGPDAADRAKEPLRDLYDLSSQIIDVAIGLPNCGIDQAAHALCDLVDLSIASRRTGWVAIDVHIRALQLLRTHGASFSEKRRNAIIDGLREVVLKRFGPPTAA